MFSLRHFHSKSIQYWLLSRNIFPKHSHISNLQPKREIYRHPSQCQCESSRRDRLFVHLRRSATAEEEEHRLNDRTTLSVKYDTAQPNIVLLTIKKGFNNQKCDLCLHLINSGQTEMIATEIGEAASPLISTFRITWNKATSRTLLTYGSCCLRPAQRFRPASNNIWMICL